MKHLKKILVMFMAVVIFCGSAVGVGAEEETPAYDRSDWLEWARLCDEIPFEYVDYFSELSLLIRDSRSSIEITNIRACKDSSWVVVSLNSHTTNDIAVHYVNNMGSVMPDTVRISTNIFAMIIDKETSTAIAVENIVIPSFKNDLVWQNIEINDILLKLPENFDKSKHELVFFNYYSFGGQYISLGSSSSRYRVYSEDPMDTYFVENRVTQAISEPVIVDLSLMDRYGSGDVNGNGKLNISDVSLTLKFIANWDIDGLDLTCADANFDGKISIDDVSMFLKRIAGWEDETIYTKHYADEYANRADKEVYYETLEEDSRNVYGDGHALRCCRRCWG